MLKIFMTGILAAFTLLAGCSGNGKEPGGSGFIEANEVVVSAETAGRILTRNFDEGSIIKTGDTLAVIDPSRIEIELASARAGRETAEASLNTARIAVATAADAEKYARSERDRIGRLAKSGSATQRQLDQLEYELTQATNTLHSASSNVTVIEAQINKIDADIDRLNRQLVDCYPLSPSSGVVTEKYISPGELVSPGKALLKISQLDTVWVKVYLPSAEFSEVKIGGTAHVSTEAGHGIYNGDVIWTSDQAEFTPKNVQTEKSRANLVYAVKVRIVNTDSKLKVGMPVYVTLEKS